MAALRTKRTFLAIVAGLLTVAVVLVAMTLRRPEPPTFAPSPVHPQPVEGRLVGPLVHTVDASDSQQWRYFSFAAGSVVEDPSPFGWDLAFRRFQVIANGGDGFQGMGGIRDMGAVPFDAVEVLPDEGYTETRIHQSDSLNAAVERWYDYSFFSHLLTPLPHVFAVRTADGRYAKMEFLGYYCPGARPGCVTFRYVYQGAGGPRLVSAPTPQAGADPRSPLHHRPGLRLQLHRPDPGVRVAEEDVSLVRHRAPHHR